MTSQRTSSGRVDADPRAQLAVLDTDRSIAPGLRLLRLAGGALALLALLIAGTFLAPNPTANAQLPTPTPTPGTTVSVVPSAQTVSAGSDVVVQVRVSNVTGLAAYEFELQYDQSVLEYSSVLNGTFLGSTGRSVTCLTPQLSTGKVRFGCVTFGTSPPSPSGSGLLATLTFHTSCGGTSPLDFTLAGLGNALGAGIPTQTQDGSASVTGGGACPTPTVTPTPGPATPTPSPSPTATATSTGPSPTPVPQLCSTTPGATFCVLPVSQPAFTGQQVTLQVALDNAANVGAYQFDLVFDSQLLSAVSVTNSTYLGSTGRSVVCLPSLLADRITFACSTLGTTPPGPSGSGILATVKLQANAVGLSNLTLENAVLAQISSAEIPIVSLQPASVTISPPPTATDTRTPTNTFTPTNTATVNSPTPPTTPTPGAGPETVVRIDPDTQLVVQGADVLADVVIESVTNMGAYSFTLDYDPELLSFIQITNSSFLGSGGGSVVCVGPDVNEVVGRLEFGCFNTSATGVTGSGTIATVRLGTSCFGSSELTLSDASVANAVGAPIATSPHNASVGVVGGTSCSLQPSATEEPTNTSTPTPSGATMLVHVAPANQGVLQGTDVLVDVAIDDVPDLGSYTFTIDYEPTLLSFVSTTNGSFLESNGGSAFCVGPVVNSVAGTAQFGCTLVGASGPTGSGILATVRFGSFCGGSGPLNLPQVGIADSLGQPIASGTQGASVTVIGSTTCPTPLPTATSTPTNTPTSPAPTPTTNVFFNPSSQGVSQGTDVIVDLEIQNVTDFGAYEFTLDYDPTLLAFASATNGPYLGSTGGVVNCVGPTVNSSTGRVTVGCVQTGAAGAIGDGVMATVTFHTSCQGADTLSLTSLDVSDSLGQPILTGSHTAAITVLGSTTCPTPVPATNTPTATPTGPTPTATGTPTPPPCGGTAAFKLCLQPASQTAEQGSNKTYQVTVANAPALGAFQVSLTWDPGIASLVSITPGSFLASTGRLVTCLAPISEPGAVHYVCVSLEPTPAGPTGSGVLANLTLKGQALGTTTLSLQDVILTNVGGVAYAPPTLQSGSLTVVAANTPTPTLSPTNTLTPTETLTPTPTLSPTPCPGVCPTATDTRTPTNTFTPTNTRTPTNTPTATPTPISGPVTMRIQPVSQSVQVGSGVTVEIVADNVTNLGAFQFHVDFAEGVTSVGSVQVGPFLGSTGRSVTCLPPTLGSGFLDYACATIGSSVPGPSGSGVIARINYVTFVEGLSIQHLSNAILTDITSSKLLPLITQDGVVAVVTPATATPPPTSTLTATATPGSPSFAAQPVLPAGMSGVAATLFVGEPGVGGGAAGSLVIPGASIAKYPAESNLFLGDQPKVIYERAFNVPAGAGVGGFELEIAFNHKLVSVDVDGQPFIDTLVGTNRSATCIKDFAEGVVRLGCVTTGTDPGPTGTFDLARIHVTPDSGLPIRPAAGNGIEVVLDDVTLNTQISNTLGSPYPLTSVGDAKVIIRALEADVNLDCSVNVADEQIIARRFGATKGSTLYETWYDLDPQTFADGDIDINDLQAIYGRHGSTCDNPWTAQEPPTKTTPTPTVTATITPTPSPPSTTPTATPGDTTPTATSTVTPTSTPGTSQEVTPTASPGPTPTSTPGGGSSGTPEPSVTPTATSAATATNTPAGSATPQPTPSATATDVADAGTTPTDTPTPITPTATLEPGVTPTNTPEVVPVATNTPPPPSTSTPVPIPTAAPAPTSTSLPAPTNTPITVRPTTVPVGTGPTNTPPSGTGPTATDTGPGGPGFVSSPTNTPVSDIAPSTEQPVSGLPDTGAASSSTEEAVTTSLAVMGFGGSLLLLIGAQLIWARRRRPEPVFKLRFQQVLSSRRTRD